MPAVLFTMVIMSVMAVAAIESATDQQRSSTAVRRSAEAFYAAETGLNAVQAEMYDTTSTLDSLSAALSSGGILDLGYDTLPSGAVYHAEVMRVDDETGQPMYVITVQADDASQMGGSRELSMIMTGLPGSGTYVLGSCCKSAALVRGETKLDKNHVIDGTDTNPSFWDAETCENYDLEDKPALIQEDLNDIDIDDEAYFKSGSETTAEDFDPPVVIEDPTIADSTFNDYGGQSWQDIKDQATKTLGDPDDIMQQEKYNWGGNPATDDEEYGPRYHYLGDGHAHSGSGDPDLGTCDTTHPLNFGYFEGPCKDFFPVVEIVSEVEMKDAGYMQGIFILAEENGIGTEFELEGPITLVGVIIGRGCVELEQGSTTIGAVFVDGDFYNDDTCAGDEPLELVDDDTSLTYSTCAAQRALSLSGIGTVDPATAEMGSLMKLGNRSFQEIIR